MALRIRRGLSSDRTTITPEEGEFLYTTDTYQVFIGDGSTPGGNPLYTLSSLGAIGLTDLSATSPLSYDNTTGVFSIQVATSTQSGYLSNTNWVTFNNKQDTLILTTTGISGAATLVGNTLNIPIYGSGGSGSGSVTSVSVVSANGFAGTVATATTTPAITLTTSITGLLKGNGTAISAATAGTDYQSPLSGTGLVVSSGGTISYVTNNSTNWDTAYTNRITSLTTTGSSGAATLVSNTLNIPNYTAAGLGAVSTSRSISTTSPLQGGGDLSTDRTLSILQATSSQSGYLSSTDWSTFNSKQAALSGTGIVKSTSGTITYLTDNSSNWNTAYGWGDHSLAGYLTSATAASTYTPLARTLTINGTTYDLSANRSWTITTGANTLDALSDVVISSPAYGDLLQYTTSNQWENVNISALISVGADNGLSFSGGNVILGGQLDINTTIATYNTTTPAQYSLSFTGGASAFSSPGAAPVKVTDTTANSTGRSTFYIGANDNHGTIVEGKGAPVTTAPTNLYRRSSANLLKNATIYSKAKQGVPLYAYSDSDETYSSVTRYSTPSTPGMLIEKTTGLTDTTVANAVTLTSGDTFGRNQLYNLLTLRLVKSATTSGLVDNTGIELSFESEQIVTSNIERLSNFRVYRPGGNDGTLSITTRTSVINDEYEGIRLSGNGVVTLPGYKPTFSNLFKEVLTAQISSGVVTGVIPTYGDVARPLIKYGDSVTVSIIDESGSGSGATLSTTLGYSLKRIRITNPGSGYVTAPTVTIAAPPAGGSAWTTGVTAIGTAVLTASGEIDYITLTTIGSRYTTVPSVTIAAPPSGTTATAVAEFGEGEVLYVGVTYGGSGYNATTTKAKVITQSYSSLTPAAYLGVNSSGGLELATISLDYLLNGHNSAAPFGANSSIVHDTQLSLTSKSFSIISASKLAFSSSNIGGTAADDGRHLFASTSDIARLYRKTQPLDTTSDITEFAGWIDAFEHPISPTYSTNFVNGLLNPSGTGALTTGSIFYYVSLNPISNDKISFYLSDTPDADDGLGINTGIKASLYLESSSDIQSINLSNKHFDASLTSSAYGTAGDSSVLSQIESNLSTTNYTTNYEVEIGGETSITSSGYYEDNSGVDTGTYDAIIATSSTSEGGLYRGIDLVATSDFPPLSGVSRIKIDSQKIYILPDNIGTVGQVLNIANATTGEVGYTTLSTVATSGDYNDLSNLPTIPSTLNDLTDVTAPSPTNGQVLSYNTSSSQWEAATFSASGLTLRTNTVNNGSQTILNLQQGTNITLVDNGSGTVTISSSGGSGGVGLDSVFMLMGA